MKNLIVTADDFGVFPCINNGVIEAVKNDKVNSVAVLTNYKDSVKNARKLLDEADNHNRPIDIGCHLTITSGKPVTLEDGKSMCDDNGNFRLYHEFSREIDPDELRNELHAQIMVLKNAGIPVKHLTCHHNSLTFFPELFDIYLEVAHDHQVPMRSPKIIPEAKHKKFISLTSFRWHDDLVRDDRRDFREFAEEIIDVFKTNTWGVKAPEVLNSRHYGPIPQARVFPPLFELLVKRKKRRLSKLFLEDIHDGCESMELMLHLADGNLRTIRDVDGIDYPGVDITYFDSRLAEFRSIMDFELGTLEGVERKGWSEVCG